jgi:hypothetical protein
MEASKEMPIPLPPMYHPDRWTGRPDRRADDNDERPKEKKKNKVYKRREKKGNRVGSFVQL